jgi:glucarate dehydratase
MDAIYHQWRDDVITTPLHYKDGALTVPTGPGLGVELDREKLGRYAEAAASAGGGGRRPADPSRPDWFPTYPAY